MQKIKGETAEKDRRDISIKAMVTCYSCSIVGHKFEMGIDFHEIKVMNILVQREGKKKHKEMSTRCIARSLRVTVIDSDYRRRLP